MMQQNNSLKKIDADYDLVRAIQNGQRDLFQDLFKRYEHVLFNFAFKMCGQASDAEDVVQEAFINVYKYLDSFRYETKFKNWLYRILTSTCIKKRRQSKFAPERELSLDEFLPADEADVQQEVPLWAALPLEQLLNEELGQVVRKAIVALPEKYRVVVVLRDIEGFSTEETAQILNLSPANVKVRLHRGRLFLRDKLKAYFSHERSSS
jgi:RNA polymerase sigma-70 factor (ECF subfamily)